MTKYMKFDPEEAPEKVLHFKSKDEFVDIDFSKEYTGSNDVPDDEKPVRRFLKLPVTKQLVFYKYRDGSEVTSVKCFRVAECFDITDIWFTLEVFTESGVIYCVHSSYFSEMQKPSFVDDMKNMITKIDEGVDDGRMD